MARVEPLPRDEAAEFEPVFQGIEGEFGFLPNSVLTFARRPALLRALADLNAAVFSGTVDPGLKRLVAYVSSNASGCRYCQAHTASFADERLGVDSERVQAAFAFEGSPLFTEGERAALRVAWGAGLSPNAVTDELFDDLRRHYTDDECVEIVGVIALYGFMNRWNDTIQTTLEQRPLAWLQEHVEVPA
jgi:AhpD family alkylhydroperoxidase